MSPRRAWALLLAVAAAVTVPAAWEASRLRIATRLEDLLPADAPAAEAYRRYLAVFGGFEKVYAIVLWRGPDPEPALLAEAADRLAEKLAASPEVAAVRAGLSRADERFLLDEVLPRAPLFLGSDAELERRLDPAAVRARVDEIRRRLQGPTGALEARWLAADPLGAGGGLAALTSGGSLGLVDPLTGAFLSPRGDAALVVVTPAREELDAAGGRALAAALAQAGRQVAAELGAPLAVSAVGGPLYAAQDERVIREDVSRTVAGSAAVVTLLLIAYFGSVGIPLALAASVAVGIVWTAGLTAAVHGEVSVLGLSFAAMLLGLGVDYGIHGASRFRAARLGGSDRPRAMSAALRETGPAILASVATTAAAFLVLVLAHFRPVRELGEVMAAGIAAILVASLAVGAPILVVARPRRGRPGPGGAAAVPRRGGCGAAWGAWSTARWHWGFGGRPRWWGRGCCSPPPRRPASPGSRSRSTCGRCAPPTTRPSRRRSCWPAGSASVWTARPWWWRTWTWAAPSPAPAGWRPRCAGWRERRSR